MSATTPLVWPELVERVQDHFVRNTAAPTFDDHEVDNAIGAALADLMVHEDRGMPSDIDFGGPIWDAIEADVYARLELDYDVAKGL